MLKNRKYDKALDDAVAFSEKLGKNTVGKGFGYIKMSGLFLAFIVITLLVSLAAFASGAASAIKKGDKDKIDNPNCESDSDQL